MVYYQKTFDIKIIMLKEQGTVLRVLHEPNPLLHQKAKAVTKVDTKVQELLHDMLATMKHNNGIGLAATQVGEMVRAIVIDIDSAYPENDQVHGGEPLFLINPEIISHSDKKVKQNEGCLSLPGAFSEVERPETVSIRYLDYNGEQKELNAGPGLLAACIQHEIDHLNGILFIDHLSNLKKNMMLKKVKKYLLQRQGS